jgi:hypothetical protein
LLLLRIGSGMLEITYKLPQNVHSPTGSPS